MNCAWLRLQAAQACLLKCLLSDCCSTTTLSSFNEPKRGKHVNGFGSVGGPGLTRIAPSGTKFKIGNFSRTSSVGGNLFWILQFYIKFLRVGIIEQYGLCHRCVLLPVQVYSSGGRCPHRCLLLPLSMLLRLPWNVYRIAIIPCDLFGAHWLFSINVSFIFWAF